MERNAKQPITLYLFSKAPQPGLVKTRMQPALSAQHSAELATMMLEETMIKVCKQWPEERVLAASPDIEHPTLQTLARRYQFRLEQQIAGDLGTKMRHVLETGILQSNAAVVMGSDVPHIPEYVVGDIYEQLRTGNNVVGPSLDGGFYMLGLTQCVEDIFEGIVWSTGSVFHRLQNNAKSKGIQLVEHPILRDIDNWDDLVWLANQDERYRKFLIADSQFQQR